MKETNYVAFYLLGGRNIEEIFGMDVACGGENIEWVAETREKMQKGFECVVWI